MDISDLNSETNQAPISHTFTMHDSIGDSANYLVIEMPTTTPETQKKQSLATVNEKEQMKEKSESSAAVQTQVLNIANVESKPKSLNQNKAIIQSTQSLVMKDL